MSKFDENLQGLKDSLNLVPSLMASLLWVEMACASLPHHAEAEGQLRKVIKLCAAIREAVGELKVPEGPIPLLDIPYGDVGSRGALLRFANLHEVSDQMDADYSFVDESTGSTHYLRVGVDNLGFLRDVSIPGKFATSGFSFDQECSVCSAAFESAFRNSWKGDRVPISTRAFNKAQHKRLFGTKPDSYTPNVRVVGHSARHCPMHGPESPGALPRHEVAQFIRTIADAQRAHVTRQAASSGGARRD